MQGYCDVYEWTILKRTSPEVKCLHLTSSRREMCTSSVSNVIYHKFSHGAAFYTLNGKNVNVMLEYSLKHLQIQFLNDVLYKTSFGKREIVDEVAILDHAYPRCHFIVRTLSLSCHSISLCQFKRLLSPINIRNDLEFFFEQKI